MAKKLDTAVFYWTEHVMYDRTPKEVEALYRKRSAIETAFRTMREARARTSLLSDGFASLQA